MKGPLDRTKVVLRHLPPGITQTMLMEQIDGVFTGRYNWVSFNSGKNSQKHQSYSRAYIDFKRAEDVMKFAEFFNGHVFVNERGTQFKTIVEYAPSQRVPRQRSKKDGREGTIYKDPEYVEFLEFLAKPVENLPSAEIQLERREAERAVTVKDAPVVTPLMDFVRQKRASKGGSRRSLSNGKPSRRGSTTVSPSSSSSKRNSEKRRISNTMYVSRDSAKSSGIKDNSTYMLVPIRDEHQPFDRSVTSAPASGTEVLEEGSGFSGITDTGKKKVLLLKGKEKEISRVSAGNSQQSNVTSSVKNILGSTSLKQSQRREGSGRIIRSILLNRDSRQSQFSGIQSEQPTQTLNLEKDKRPPRPAHVQFVARDTNGIPGDKVVGNDLHGFCNEKQEKRTRSKDRPDRGVWTLRRSDGSHASDESLSSSGSQSAQSLMDSAEGSHGDVKVDMSNVQCGKVRILRNGRSGHPLDHRSHKHVGRRGPSQSVKDVDGIVAISEGKPLRRGGTSGNGSYEKQVWVQKSSSGS